MSITHINISDFLKNKIQNTFFVSPANKSEMQNIVSSLDLKLVSATFLLVCFVCPKEGTCEAKKIVFYFTLKALFVLEIIKF